MIDRSSPILLGDDAGPDDVITHYRSEIFSGIGRPWGFALHLLFTQMA
jgi:hypothetical protein